MAIERRQPLNTLTSSSALSTTTDSQTARALADAWSRHSRLPQGKQALVATWSSTACASLRRLTKVCARLRPCRSLGTRRGARAARPTPPPAPQHESAAAPSGQSATSGRAAFIWVPQQRPSPKSRQLKPLRCRLGAIAHPRHSSRLARPAPHHKRMLCAARAQHTGNDVDTCTFFRVFGRVFRLEFSRRTCRHKASEGHAHWRHFLPESIL